MGFLSSFSRNKKLGLRVGGDAGTIVSEMTEPGRGNNGNNNNNNSDNNSETNSDISDSYVAPSAEDLEAGGAASPVVKTKSSPAVEVAAAAAPAATAATTTSTKEASGENATFPNEAVTAATTTTPTNTTATPAPLLEKAPSLEEQVSDLSKEFADSAKAITQELATDATSFTQRITASATSFANQLSERKIDLESVEDGYVNANNITNDDNGNGGTNKTTKRGSDGSLEIMEHGDANDDDEEMKDVFNGVKGTVQPPKYKDVKYALAFVAHFGVTIWWFVDSFFPAYDQYNGGYYNNKINHVGLAAAVATTALAGLGLAFLTFGYMLRHGETVLKTTIVFSVSMCLGVGVLGLLFGELVICLCGLVGFAIVGMYANMVWERVPFTAINLSVAITAIRENMGIFIVGLLASLAGFVWLIITITAAIHAHQRWGWWTTVYTIFSYYWTHQVLTNVVSVTTAGIIGRWFVLGECTRNFTTGLKEMLNRTVTHSFGCICFGSLFFGIVQIIQGLCSFLRRKRVPLLPQALDWVLTKITLIIDIVNEWAYVYVGLYSYSYTSAGRNVNTLFLNKGFENIVKDKFAGNIMFMANMGIGLLTGFSGLMFGIFEYGIMWQSGLANPTTDGFFIGFLVGFMFSSIMLSIVTATTNTVIVCLAESPAAFKINHPDESKRLESVWKEKTKSWLFF